MAYNNNSNPTPDARTASTTYPATGTGAWTSGFVAYIPIPLLNSVIAGIVMMVIGLGQRKKGGVAAQNGANAANWGVLQIVIPVIFFATMTIGLLAGEKTETGVRMHGGMGGGTRGHRHPVVSVLHCPPGGDNRRHCEIPSR